MNSINIKTIDGSHASIERSKIEEFETFWLLFNKNPNYKISFLKFVK